MINPVPPRFKPVCAANKFHHVLDTFFQIVVTDRPLPQPKASNQAVFLNRRYEKGWTPDIGDIV